MAGERRRQEVEEAVGKTRGEQGMPRSEVHRWSATSDQAEKNRSVKKFLCCECKSEQPFKKSTIANEKGKKE
jgi:hypothetical protein